MAEDRGRVAPLILRGEEWRHRDDPASGMKDGGAWVRRVQHPPLPGQGDNIQHYGATSPHPSNRDECHLMLAYLDRLNWAHPGLGRSGADQ